MDLMLLSSVLLGKYIGKILPIGGLAIAVRKSMIAKINGGQRPIGK